MRPTTLLKMLLALLLLNLSACSSWQTVRVETAMKNSPPPGVDFGSLVKIRTFEGERAEFRVTEIGNDGLGGSSAGFFLYEDMKSLEVDKPGTDNGETLGIILGIIGVAALVALVANADSVAVCSPSPCQAPD